MDTTCKNCKHDAGDHHYKTNKCPVGITIYEPDDSVSAVIHTQAQTIERLANALELLEIYIRHAASGVDIRWHNVNADEGEAARALLAEIRMAK